MKEHLVDVPFVIRKGFEYMCCKEYNVVFIRENYFRDNSSFVEMLDPVDRIKQTQRKYVFLNFKYEDNNIFVPLRTEMPDMSNIGTIGYPVPSKSKPNAGLDYRKILIINNMEYIEMSEYSKIPESQQKIITSDYETIKKQVGAYIEGYIKSAKKKRQYKDKKYKYSTLHNFHDELHI